MNSTVLRAARLPISIAVSALVVVVLLLLPNNVAGFGLKVTVEGTGALGNEFALGNEVPFTINLVLDLKEVLSSTVTMDISGPDGFERGITGIPLGGKLPGGATSAADQQTTFGPSTETADVAVSVSTPVADTTISGTVTHVGVLTEFDQPFAGYGFGYKATVNNASITVDGVLILPSGATAGTYVLSITVDNDPTKGPSQTQSVTLIFLPSAVATLEGLGKWSTFSIPVTAKNPKIITENGLGTAEQDGLLNEAELAIVWKYDASITDWVSVVKGTATNILLPTDAVLVRASDTVGSVGATLIFSPERTNPPQRPLTAGWNLFGLAVPPASTTMDAAEALISVKETAGGLPGYSIVVSPSINDDPFILTRPLAAQDLTTFRGYWVFMENDDTLAGFSTTPVE